MKKTGDPSPPHTHTRARTHRVTHARTHSQACTHSHARTTLPPPPNTHTILGARTKDNMLGGRTRDDTYTGWQDQRLYSGWKDQRQYSGQKDQRQYLFWVQGTLRASLSGTFLQTLPDLVTPLKGYSLSPRICPPTLSAPSEWFGY